MHPDTVVFHNGRPATVRQVADELQNLSVNPVHIDAYLKSCVLFAGQRRTSRGGIEYEETPAGNWEKVSESSGKSKASTDSDDTKSSGAAPSASGAAKNLGIDSESSAKEHMQDLAKQISQIGGGKQEDWLSKAAPAPKAAPDHIQDKVNSWVAKNRPGADPKDFYHDPQAKEGKEVQEHHPAVKFLTAVFTGDVARLKRQGEKAFNAVTHPIERIADGIAALPGMGDQVGGLVAQSLRLMMGKGPGKTGSQAAVQAAVEHHDRLSAKYGRGLANLAMAGGHLFTGAVTGAMVAGGPLAILTGAATGPVGMGVAAAGIGLNALLRHTSLREHLVALPSYLAMGALKLGKGAVSLGKLAAGKKAEMSAFFADDMITSEQIPDLKKPISRKDLVKLVIDTHADITARTIAGWLKDPEIGKGLAALAVAMKKNPKLFSQFKAAKFSSEGTVIFRGREAPYHVARAELAAIGLRGADLDAELARLQPAF
jgi:hypothetical protein